MGEKLSTGTVFRTGDVVHLHLNLPSDSGALFRVVFADIVGVCAMPLADTLHDLDRDPVFAPVEIRGSFFYPWQSVDYVHLVMDSNAYVASYGDTQ